MTARVSAGLLRLFVAAHESGRQFALVRDRSLVEYRIDRPGAASRIGEIHLGRVLRVDKGVAAAFIDLGLDRPALLPLGDHDGRPAEGETMAVQITRDARDGKGARVTGHPVLPGMFLVFDPHHAGLGMSARIGDRPAAERLRALVGPLCTTGGGFIIRHAAARATPTQLADEAARLRTVWQEIEARRAGLRPSALLHRDADPVLALLRDAGADIDEIVTDSRGAAETLRHRLGTALPELAGHVAFRPLRDWVPSLEEIVEQVDAALDPEVALPGGGFLLFEPGRTLTAIDVNSGGAAIEGGGRKAAARRLVDVNLAAAAEIARQLRLRNLGGIIVIDFIDVKGGPARARVVEALEAALAGDPAPCQIGAMSRFGLVEMTRRRRGASLSELLTATCPTCAGSGRLRRAGVPQPGGEP